DLVVQDDRQLAVERAALGGLIQRGQLVEARATCRVEREVDGPAPVLVRAPARAGQEVAEDLLVLRLRVADEDEVLVLLTQTTVPRWQALGVVGVGDLAAVHEEVRPRRDERPPLGPGPGSFLPLG